MASQGPSGVTWSFTLLVMLLFAGCGGAGGDSGGGGAAGPAPTAQATADQTVPVGTPTTLDGKASESPSGAPLSYLWTLTAKPASSAASLINPNSVRASFTPDVAGTYTGTLVVRANGVDSAPDAVTVNAVTGNVAPVANAGPDRNAAPSKPITLDGTTSHDPNQTSITYSWRIVEQPPGSHPTLTDATSATPTFMADVAGRYVLALTCSDGIAASTIDQVVIIVATGNLSPVANAGPDQSVTAGQQVTLDGTRSSDPNDDPLTYSWCMKGRPVGSAATLSGANTARPTFTPDVAGSYVFCLTVSDGKLGSNSDSVVVEARLPSSGSGALQAYIKPSNTTLWPGVLAFGQSVALDGETLAVGVVDPSCATGVNGNPMDASCLDVGAGAVYVFTRSGTTWSQQAYLKPSSTQGGGFFGTSVSLSGNTLAVAAPGVRGVYVFTRTGSTWTQQAFVRGPNPTTDPAASFGLVVALSGNTLAVNGGEQTCALENSCQPGLGVVYVFTRSNGAWSQQAVVKPPDKPGTLDELIALGGFGRQLALDGDTLAVGNDLNGSFYVFARTAGVWTQQTSKPGAFQNSLAIKGDTLIVGANDNSCAVDFNGTPLEPGCIGPTAVYIFSRTNNLWSQTAYVKPTPPNATRVDIGAVAFDGTTVAVGASDNNCATGFNPSPASSDCFGSGAVYLFTRTSTSWAQRAYVKASNTDAGDFFGLNVNPYRLAGPPISSVAISGNTLAVGAIGEDSCATGINGNQTDNSCGPNTSPEFQTAGGSGAVYVYAMQ